MNTGPKTPFVLCATKIDLRDDAEIKKKLAAQYGSKPISFEEVSCLYVCLLLFDIR